MKWVKLNAIVVLHDTMLREHGGLPGLSAEGRGKLESALQRPQNLAHYEGVDDIMHLAATYLVGVAAAHAFADANKRTAWLCANLFLDVNGVELVCEPTEIVELVVSVADSRLNVTTETVAEWLRARKKR